VNERREIYTEGGREGGRMGDKERGRDRGRGRERERKRKPKQQKWHLYLDTYDAVEITLRLVT